MTISALAEQIVEYRIAKILPAVFLAVTILMSFESEAAEKKRTRSNDLTGVMIDLDEGNKGLEITSAMKEEDGIELIIHRLTIGRFLKKTVDGKQTDDADPFFAERAKQAAKAGIRFGAYHVVWPSPSGLDNGEEQARGFLTALGEKCVPGQQIVLAVDWEETKCKGGKSCGTPEPSYVKSFIKTVRDFTGKPLLVYTSGQTLAKFSKEIASATKIGGVLRDNPLWFSQYYRAYTHEKGDKPKFRTGFIFPLAVDHQPWDRWTFWQYAASEIDGPPPTRATSLTVRNHRVDLNWFAGGRDQFFDFYNAHAISCEQVRNFVVTAK